MSAQYLPQQLRAGQAVGYWLVTPNVVMAERVARMDYDYVGIDVQHGIVDYQTLVACLIAIDAGGSRSVVRVSGLNPSEIGRTLDAGASGIVVPMINNPAEAKAAVAAVRYPPLGARSYGPIRSGMRIGPNPSDVHEQVALILMIETEEGLRNVESIAAVDGVDGIYVGPSDLSLGLGAETTAPENRPITFQPALSRVREAAVNANIASGIHVGDGESAAKALADGFTFVSVASELMHAIFAAEKHLSIVRGAALAPTQG